MGGNPTRSRLNECIAALTGTYTFSCCCGGGVYSVTILCDKYDCNYTERNIKATMCPLDTSEPSKCVFSGTFDAREVIDLSTCDVTKMITASYDLPECDISENDFDLNLPEEKFTTPIGLLIQNVLPDDGTIDISFIRKDRSPKKAANVSSSFEERRVEAIRYSDNAEEGHRLLAAASEFEMKALMETHRRLFQCGLEPRGRRFSIDDKSKRLEDIPWENLKKRLSASADLIDTTNNNYVEECLLLYNDKHYPDGRIGKNGQY